MDDDLEEEEVSLMMLQEQLAAVQKIRQELRAKDDQIQTLKLQVAETACYRQQAINLRSQVRILEERIGLMVSNVACFLSM